MRYFFYLVFLFLFACRTEQERLAQESRDQTRSEIVFGRYLALSFLYKYPLLRDREPTLIINKLTSELAKFGPRKELVFTVGILDESEPLAISLPGGFTFISKGMISLWQSEEDAYFLLAHEIIHSQLSHSYSYENDKGFSKFLQSGLDPSGGALLAIQSIQENWIREILEKGRDKELEYEADLEGSYLLQLFGCPSDVGISFLRTMDKKTNQEDWMSRTHPTFESRTKALENNKKNRTQINNPCPKIFSLADLKKSLQNE